MPSVGPESARDGRRAEIVRLRAAQIGDRRGGRLGRCAGDRAERDL